MVGKEHPPQHGLPTTIFVPHKNRGLISTTHAAAKWVQRASALLGVFVGGSAIAGWLLGVPRLTDWAGVGVSMFFNTGLAMVLTGAALWLRNRPHISGVRLCAAVAGCIGAATGCEHLFGVDLGIDQLFVVAEWGQLAATSPGRMGPPASFMFTMLNASLLLSTFGRKWHPMAVVGAGVCVAISTLSILGYLFQAQHFYLLPHISAIALNTSLSFLLLGAGLIASLHDVEPMRTLLEGSATGALVRRALPVLVLVPLVIALLRSLGETAGLYDARFGAVLRTVVEILLLLVVLWWLARSVREHEHKRRESEQAVRDSEQRYQAFIQNSSEGIWRCELQEPMPITLSATDALDWVYQHAYMAECNDAMARMYGYTKGTELVGARLGDLAPRNPENEAYLNAFIAAGYLLLGGQSEERDKDGNTVFLSNNLVGIVEDGYFVRAWGTQVDITGQKRSQQALMDADRRKDEFLATLAHELRNPLTPLMNGMELISTGEQHLGPGERAGLTAMMFRQLRHMTRLIDDLLDISRINRGKITLHQERIDLAEVFSMSVESVRSTMGSMGHSLVTDFPTGPLYLHGDHTRLVQVFGNLLSNAAKFTPPGGRIRFSAETHGDQLVVLVEDNGIGLAAEHLTTIFDMFSQVDTTLHREQNGLGIGLALVKRLVHKHGGTVSAFSDGPGRGTTIRVQLPLLVAEAMNEVAEQGRRERI